MADFTALKTSIQQFIKQNGNGEITGNLLQTILLSMVTNMGDGAINDLAAQITAEVQARTGADGTLSSSITSLDESLTALTNKVAEGYIYKGIATTSTVVGTILGKVFYLTATAGTYSNMGGVTVNAGISVISYNGSTWAVEQLLGMDNVPTENSQKMVKSGGVFNAIATETARALAAETASVDFNSTTKYMQFKNSAGTVLYQFDATPFIIDGMVDNVVIIGGNLVISFNTDAGKQDIEIPLTEIFNPSNYYTKSDVDSLLQDLSASISTLNTQIASGYLYKGIATPSTTPATPVTKEFYFATTAGTYTNFLDSSSAALVLTQGINILKHDGTAWSVEQVWSVDDEPTAGSNNLVKSGGIYNELALGAIYDVSAKNPTAGPNNDGKWESLSALLSDANLNTLIPTSVRKGGMSIKFVLTSDNKYVQYWLMAQSFTTDVTKWSIYPPVTVVTNKKYTYAVIDSNEIFLFGIRRDTGKMEFGFGLPEPIIQALEAIEESISLGYGVELKDIVKILQTSDVSSVLVDSDEKELETIRKNGEKVSRLIYDFRNGFKLNGRLYKDIKESYSKSASPLMFNLVGDGSESSPYTYSDGAAGITSAISTLTRGGLVTIPCSKYNISSSITLTSRNVRIVGECQAFPDDPLAVRPATSGTAINLTVNTIPAFILNPNAGGEMSHLGIYGTERGGNVANLFNKNNYLYNLGICLKGHVDQVDFHRMSISGLACGLVFDTDGMVDGCIFDNLNFDGCDFGIYQPTTTSWCGNSKFENLMLADLSGRALHFSNITRFSFKDICIAGVGGGTPTQIETFDNIRTTAYFKASSSIFFAFDVFNSGHVNRSGIPNWNSEYDGECYGIYIEGDRNNITTNKFNYVSDYCLYVKGNKNIISTNNITGSNVKGIYVEGNDNIITDNIIQLASTQNIAVYIKGNNNVVDGNLTDGQIVIDGDYNKVMNHTSKTSSAYIMISGNDNTLYDINTSEVTDNGINTNFKNF